ncbi:MAG: MaoC family dehydratase [Porticoccaceae bacterium]|jgi:3-hydroxybutyryl-CoA dehydratase
MLVKMNKIPKLPQTLTPARMVIGTEEILAYATMSGDFNSIHMDVEAAQDAGFKDIIAHGTLALNLIWESVERTFDFVQQPEITVDISFKVPVYRGQTVETGSMRLSKIGNYEVWISDQDGIRAIEGTLQIHFDTVNDE